MYYVCTIYIQISTMVVYIFGFSHQYDFKFFLGMKTVLWSESDIIQLICIPNEICNTNFFVFYYFCKTCLDFEMNVTIWLVFDREKKHT